MNKGVGMPVTAVKEKEKVSFNIRIPKETKMKLPLGKLKVGEKHHVSIHGTVNSVSQDEYGQNFGMDVQGIDLGGSGDGQSSLGGDLKNLRGKRTVKYTAEEEAAEGE